MTMETKPHFVSAARAGAHILALQVTGIGTKPIAAVCDVDRKKIRAIRTGKNKWIRVELEQRILAVDEGARADGSWIDATRTRELLRELYFVRRFSALELARKCLRVVSPSQFYRTMVAPGAYAPRRVYARTAARVERFHRLAVAGAVVPDPALAGWRAEKKTVDVSETWRLLRILLRSYSREQLIASTGYIPRDGAKRIAIQHAEKVAAFYKTSVAMREEEPLPEDWRTSARPVNGIGVEEWLGGGWSVVRGSCGWPEAARTHRNTRISAPRQGARGSFATPRAPIENAFLIRRFQVVR